MCCRVSDIRFCIALIFPLGLANFAVVLYSVIVYDYPLTNFIEDNFSAKSCLIWDKKILSAVLTNKLSNFSSFMEIKFIFLFLNLTSDSCWYSAHWMIVTWPRWTEIRRVQIFCKKITGLPPYISIMKLVPSFHQRRMIWWWWDKSWKNWWF